METLPSSPVGATTDPIAAGDLAASAGDWVEAVSRWEEGLNGDRSSLATDRLRWFVDQQAPGTATQQSPRTVLLLVGLASALIGTAVVLWARSTDGSLATVLSIIAWLLYGTTAGMAILYARRSGPSLQVDESPVDLAAVHAAANALAHSPAPTTADVAR